MSAIDPRLTAEGLISSFIIICGWSLAIKSNHLFLLTEDITIASYAAILLTAIYSALVSTVWTPTIAGNYWLIIPIILGLAVFTRFTPKYNWINRYSSAFCVGIGTGIAMRGAIDASIVQQVVGTISLFTAIQTPVDAFNTILFAAITVSVLLYFMFAYENKAFGYLAKFGRAAMMLAFGAAIVTHWATRQSVLTGALAWFLWGIR